MTETFHIEFPIFAFSHCRDVVAAVSCDGGHGGAEVLATYRVGQAVGLMNAEQSVADVMLGFKTDFIGAHGRISAFIEGVDDAASE